MDQRTKVIWKRWKTRMGEESFRQKKSHKSVWNRAKRNQRNWSEGQYNKLDTTSPTSSLKQKNTPSHHTWEQGPPLSPQLSCFSSQLWVSQCFSIPFLWLPRGTRQWARKKIWPLSRSMNKIEKSIVGEMEEWDGKPLKGPKSSIITRTVGSLKNRTCLLEIYDDHWWQTKPIGVGIKHPNVEVDYPYSKRPTSAGQEGSSFLPSWKHHRDFPHALKTKSRWDQAKWPSMNWTLFICYRFHTEICASMWDFLMQLGVLGIIITGNHYTLR